MSMNLANAKDYVKIGILENTPSIMWGPPGIGKSAIVRQIAEELGRVFLDLRLAQLDPTDLRGIPMPNRDTMRADWFLPSFWPECADKDGQKKIDGKIYKYKAGDCPDGPGILFLDEIEKAPVSVKNAALQLVLDRKIGDYTLPNDWDIVCAANREEDGCYSQPLGTALDNRLYHLEVEADIDTWAKWARESDVTDDIIGFLLFRPDLLYKATGDHAFPSPRSWTSGSKLISRAKTQKAKKDLLGACVGKECSSEFVVWQTVYKDVKPEEILTKGEMPDFDGKDQSFKYAVAMAVAFYLRKRKGGIKNCEQNLANFMGVLGAELKVVMLKQQTLPTLEAMMKHKAFKDMVKDMMKVIV